MKIAYILPSLINKGPVIVSNNIINNLNDKVELIDVFYFDKTNTQLSFNCNTYQIKKNDLIDFDKYDIIHSHTLRADMYVHKWRKKILVAKTVSTLHQDTYNSFSLRYNRLVSYILTQYWNYIQRSFDGIIAISNQLKNKYNKLLSNNVTTIYNGCNIDSVEVDLGIKNKILSLKKKGYNVLGAYAHITKDKGLQQVIEALIYLPDYSFVIIGEGPYLSQLKEDASRLNLAERTLFIPYTKFPYSYLQFIDVYMMPSYVEGFGLAMVEAALKKKSIVCSNIPSFHELFNSKEVCFFDLNNSKSITEAIKKAYLNRNSLGEMAFIKAKENFSAEIMSNNHLDYYKNITKKDVNI